MARDDWFASRGGQEVPPRPSQSGSEENEHGLRLVASPLGIALVGTYPPRRCGIATFTRDLAAALTSAGERVTPVALALTDPGAQYEYAGEVKYEIRQGVKADYARAAEFVNYSDVRLVSIHTNTGSSGAKTGPMSTTSWRPCRCRRSPPSTPSSSILRTRNGRPSSVWPSDVPGWWS